MLLTNPQEYIWQSDRYYQNYVKYLKGEFNKPSKASCIKLFEHLILEGDGRIKDGRIDCNGIFTHDDRFVRTNGKRFEQMIIKKEYALQIIQWFNLYIKNVEAEGNPDTLSDSYESYSTLTVDNYNKMLGKKGFDKLSHYDNDPNYIIPDENYNFRTLIKNFKRNLRAEHKFNRLIPESFDLSISSIQRSSF